MRYAITFSYDGSPFCGWQVQPGHPSVQGCLEEALSTLLRTDIPVTGAGRTDTGVNAVGYVAHFDGPDGLDADAFSYKLNAILPRSIAIRGIVPVADGFHARFDARCREYTYFLHRPKDPFVERYSYRYTFPLDVPAMDEAARHLLGTHDFSSFEKTGGSNKTSACTVFEAGWHTYTPAYAEIMGAPADEGAYLYFRIAADRFLRNMVRAVVGTLLEVGRGRRAPGDIAALLAAHDRCAAGESVPGHALFLSRVRYDAPACLRCPGA